MIQLGQIAPGFTPVCTKASGETARLSPEFLRRGAGVIGLPVDPLGRHAEWDVDIAETQDHAANPRWC